MELNKSLIISAFPGVGKSFLFKESSNDYLISDSDSSKFPKDEFPENYIDHIKSLIGEKDIILVSSHEEVRNALRADGIDFILVYPSLNCKGEYIKRYIERGSPNSFVTMMIENWEKFINQCKNQLGCKKYELEPEEYLSDIIPQIIEDND